MDYLQRVVAIPYRCFGTSCRFHLQKSRIQDASCILYFADRACASLYNLFPMKPTKCTLLLSIFFSTSLHVSDNCVPIIRRTYCIYATLVFCTLYGWLSGRLVGMRHIPTRQPLIQSEKYQCRIDTVSSPDDGRIVARNM